MWKETTTSYKFRKADNYHKHHKIQKNNYFINQLRDTPL